MFRTVNMSHNGADSAERRIEELHAVIEIIPVIDLKSGVVVHAVRGQRDRYCNRYIQDQQQDKRQLQYS